MTAAFILSELQSVGTPEKAVHLSRFFKTGPGQYGEGDQFLGVVVPQTRSIAKANKATPFDELQLLLDSPWHEARLCALLILVYRFQDRKAMPEEREAIFRFYLKNMRRCNNWDLVDLTCRISSANIWWTKIVPSSTVWRKARIYGNNGSRSSLRGHLSVGMILGIPWSYPNG